jgi:hypothetical protein
LPLIRRVVEFALNRGVHLEAGRYRVKDLLPRRSGDDPGKEAS